MPIPAMPVLTDAWLCGWRVHSELELPELYPWQGEDRPADITLRLIASAPELSEGKLSEYPEGRILVEPMATFLDVYGVARFTIRNGVEVLISLYEGVAPPLVRNFLYGTVLGVLCHQRGLYPLHAACLRIGTGVCAFSGDSGAGKSTLAAALAARGHALLSDDLCVLDLRGPRPVVLPAFPRVKLWPQSIQALAVEAPELLHDGEKHHFHFAPVAAFTAEPLPLEAVYFLRAADEALPEGIHPQSPLEAVRLLQHQIFRHSLAHDMGRTRELFAHSAAIASAVPVSLLARRMDLAHIPATVALLEARHAPQTSPVPA